MTFAKTFAKMVAAFERYHAEPVVEHVLPGEQVYLGSADRPVAAWHYRATTPAPPALELVKADKAPPAVFVSDRDDLPASDKWLAALRGHGAEVTHAKLPGYVEMVLDAHKTEIPEAIIGAVLARATAWSAGAEATPASRLPHARVARFGVVVVV